MLQIDTKKFGYQKEILIVSTFLLKNAVATLNYSGNAIKGLQSLIIFYLLMQFGSTLEIGEFLMTSIHPCKHTLLWSPENLQLSSDLSNCQCPSCICRYCIAVSEHRCITAYKANKSSLISKVEPNSIS